MSPVTEGSQNPHEFQAPVSLPNEQDSLYGKRNVESLPFDYQFAEVEKAIINFTKHQQFNHHYAPNVNMNRNNNHHHNHNHNQNTNRHNNNYKHQHHQQQQSFALNAQLKQQQQQQFINSANPQHFNRYRQINKGMASHNAQQQQQQHQTQQPQQFIQTQYLNDQLQQQQQLQQQLQQLQMSQQYQVPVQQLQKQQEFQQQIPFNTGMVHSGELKFDNFQQVQPQLNHPDLMAQIRNSSPTFSAPIRPGSVGAFGAPLEQINSNSSFGLTNSDLLNTPMTPASSNGEYIEKKLSLEDSNSSYLGDIWGNSKSLRNSASVWA